MNTIKSNILKKNKKKNKFYCNNCGKYGHYYKNCNDPVSSYGVINFVISTDDNKLIDSFINKFTIDDKNIFNNKKYNPMSKGIGFESPNDIENFSMYKNNIKFLMIRRKHSLGYIEFIRGRYNIENVDGIIFLFRQMTSNEIKKIGNSDFDDLWNDLWQNNINKNNYHNEYLLSKKSFEKLKNYDGENFLNLQFYVNNVKPTWKNPEWGFPKGRRNFKESDVECAFREFNEETCIENNEYVFLDKLIPIEEYLIGTNGVQYKHIYYLTLSTNDRVPVINEDNISQSSEIGDIGWFCYDDAIKLIRNHHIERRKLLTQLYMFIINSIMKIRKKNNKFI